MTDNQTEPIAIADPARWVVWIDLDDTLWDFHNNSLIALADTYNHFGLGRYWSDVDAWRDDYHRVNDRLWTELAAGVIDQPYLRRQRFYEPFTAAGMPAGEAERTTVLADAYYLAQLGKLSATVPGARDLLDRLHRRGFRIGILSNGFKEVQYNKLRSAGIIDMIDIVVLSDEIMVNKPDIRLYRHAEQKADVPACRSIMIGDNSSTDIAGAVSAGWAMAIWFNSGGKNCELSDSTTDTIVVTVDNLDKIRL